MSLPDGKVEDLQPGARPPGLAHLPWEKASVVYQVVGARRTSFDVTMWQVPALGLTAQAFLLTIALGPDTGTTSRLIASGLAVIVALVAIQTMYKHRANERTDSRILTQLEEANGITLANQVHPHHRPSVRGEAVDNKHLDWRINKLKSFELWILSLSCFAIAAGFAFGVSICDPELLEGRQAGSAVNASAGELSPAPGRDR